MRYTLGVKEGIFPSCKHLINSGDVIILATDGLFDNLFDDEIVDIVNKNENESLKVSSYSQLKSRTLLRRWSTKLIWLVETPRRQHPFRHLQLTS